MLAVEFDAELPKFLIMLVMIDLALSGLNDPSQFA